MTVLNVTEPYVSGDNVTADNLNKLVNDAEFTVDTTDNSTLEVHSAGYLKVKDDGIQAQHLKSDPDNANDAQRAVTTNHIQNGNVTTAKIQELPAKTFIGNNTNSSANPTAVPIDDLTAKISSTDIVLNVNDTHQTIGLGILANASSSFPRVKMDGGVQIGDQAPSLTSIESELSVTGNGNFNLMTVENTSTTDTDQSVVVIKGPIPTLQLNDTVAPTDQGVMNLNMTGGELRFTQIRDDSTTTDLVKIKPDEMTVENGTGVAKIKIINTSSSGGGASLKLQSNVPVTTNEGDYSIFIGGANGKFNIQNERASKTLLMDADGDWYALSNTQDLGKTGNRWDDVWSNGTFNGSDRNIKQDIQDLDEAEKRVAVKCKGLIKKYRMKDAVTKKGNDARIHVGIIAQELQAAFESEGLDPFRYSMIGKDTWWEAIDAEGNRDVKYEATVGYTEVTQMSVRYNELLAFIISAM